MSITPPYPQIRRHEVDLEDLSRLRMISMSTMPLQKTQRRVQHGHFKMNTTAAAALDVPERPAAARLM